MFEPAVKLQKTVKVSQSSETILILSHASVNGPVPETDTPEISTDIQNNVSSNIHSATIVNLEVTKSEEAIDSVLNPMQLEYDQTNNVAENNKPETGVEVRLCPTNEHSKMDLPYQPQPHSVTLPYAAVHGVSIPFSGE